MKSLLEQSIQQKLDNLIKPQGSLGKLENIVLKLGKIQNSISPKVDNKRIYIFAGDHGIAEKNVSAYPPSVTAQMVQNYIHGGAAIYVLANQYNINLKVVDVGVNTNFEASLPIDHKKIRKGTRNFLEQEAMTEEELNNALKIGKECVKQAKKDNIDILGVGDMGIGNTTAASAISACLLQKSPDEVTSKGTGINEKQLQYKINVIIEALSKHKPNSHDGLDILKKIGGYEIAAITGLALGCKEENIALVTDGFITTSAIAVASLLEPDVKHIIFPSHQSEEKGHKYLLEYLDISPILDLNMRLGEGTGSALAMPIIDSAVNLYNKMATFEDAKVDDKI